MTKKKRILLFALAAVVAVLAMLWVFFFETWLGPLVPYKIWALDRSRAVVNLRN